MTNPNRRKRPQQTEIVVFVATAPVYIYMSRKNSRWIMSKVSVDNENIDLGNLETLTSQPQTDHKAQNDARNALFDCEDWPAWGFGG